ncbi:MAG: acyl--CoA ligase [Alphaproteobacteria bacterium]|nr:acyl--CoA ligase [Alphaproteobacteria bacterium]
MERAAHSNYLDGVLEQARLRPGAPALDTAAGIVTYRDFAAALGGVAAGLARQGLVPGDGVAILCGDAGDYLRAALGAALGGFVVVAVDPDWPAGDIARLLALTGVAAIVGDGAAAGALPVLPPASLAPADPWAARHPGGPHTVQVAVSSGTTGPSKAAPVAHDQLLRRTRAMTEALGVGAADRYLPIVAMPFAIGRGPALRVLDVGGTVVLRPPAATIAEHVADLAALGITYLSVTPSHVHSYLDALPPAAAPAMPGVRVLTVNSAMLAPGVRRQVRSRLTPGLHITYGTNEAGYVAHAGPADLGRRPATVGRAFPGMAIEIVDDAGRALPPGTVGEVRVRTPFVASAYLDDAAATGRAHRGGWFHPGDVGHLDADGFLFLAGRVDDRINAGGIKVYPAEIEAALLAHPAVAEAAAVGWRSARLGEAPVAAVVLRSPVPEAALRAFARDRLGAEKTPRRVLAVPALPRSPTGKVPPRELRRLLEALLAGAASA